MYLVNHPAGVRTGGRGYRCFDLQKSWVPHSSVDFCATSRHVQKCLQAWSSYLGAPMHPCIPRMVPRIAKQSVNHEVWSTKHI